MTFLKKLGQFLAQAVSIATGVGPLIQPFLGSQAKQEVFSSGVNDLTQIAQVVVQAEALIQTPGSGASKLAAASPLIASIIKTSELVAGKKIANETLFTQSCQQIASGVAGILNSLHPDDVKTA